MAYRPRKNLYLCPKCSKPQPPAMDGDAEAIEVQCFRDAEGKRHFEPFRVLECGHLISTLQHPWVGGDVTPLPLDIRRTPSDPEEKGG